MNLETIRFSELGRTAWFLAGPEQPDSAEVHSLCLHRKDYENAGRQFSIEGEKLRKGPRREFTPDHKVIRFDP